MARRSLGGKLYVEEREGGGSYLYRYRLDGRDNWMSVGKVADVSEEQARQELARQSEIVREGRDPVRERVAVRRRGLTVEDAVREYWSLHCRHLAKHEVWIRMFEIHVFPKVGRVPVAQLTADEVLKVLKPIWKDQYPTAKRLRTRLGLVLRHVSIDDPRVDIAIPDRVKARLGTVQWQERPHPALPWEKVPAVFEALSSSVAHNALKLLILSGVRVACVTRAEWNEVDFDAAIWTVPKERVKGWKSGFRVPLTGGMIDVLRRQWHRRGESKLVFASKDAWKRAYVSENTFNKWLRENDWKDEQGEAVTAHGFRSSFRDWASQARVERDLAEHCIQHVSAQGTRVERAYWREDRLEARRGVMEAWSAFVTGISAEERREALAQKSEALHRWHRDVPYVEADLRGIKADWDDVD
ncbi:DUF4102 domain-containing protein [Silicimonas algicola]|uniref:Integrase n=1 Tax=Silicimonas algicola TaxID=1826607 RepID=A0A316G5Z1_9RHOB|nr:site-specific integrase [Silicimonas algicola]AZQ66886.1 DUF4102 domain-containing protein [Silicimonas algicola]PWK55200.1 integrase [Silicimonas algicola]